MTDPAEESKEVKFPFAGIDRQGGFDQQPNKPIPLDESYARTTYLGKNVRAVDPATDRVRGASRPGLSKYIPATVSGLAGFPVQHLNVIVDPQTPATLGSFTGTTGIIGGVPGVTSGTPDPSTNNRFTSTGNPTDRRSPTSGRTVPPGGSGVPLVRNRPTSDIVLGDKRLILWGGPLLAAAVAADTPVQAILSAGGYTTTNIHTDVLVPYPKGILWSHWGLPFDPDAALAATTTVTETAFTGNVMGVENTTFTYEPQRVVGTLVKVQIAGYTSLSEGNITGPFHLVGSNGTPPITAGSGWTVETVANPPFNVAGVGIRAWKPAKKTQWTTGIEYATGRGCTVKILWMLFRDPTAVGHNGEEDLSGFTTMVQHAADISPHITVQTVTGGTRSEAFANAVAAAVAWLRTNL